MIRYLFKIAMTIFYLGAYWFVFENLDALLNFRSTVVVTIGAILLLVLVTATGSLIFLLWKNDVETLVKFIKRSINV